MNIGATILSQLGGNKFIAMTGAKNFIGRNDGLAFALPGRTANKANKVVITLQSNDTYTVEFGRIRSHEYSFISEHDHVYADELQQVITRQTGLHTSL